MYKKNIAAGSCCHFHLQNNFFVELTLKLKILIFCRSIWQNCIYREEKRMKKVIRTRPNSLSILLWVYACSILLTSLLLLYRFFLSSLISSLVLAPPYLHILYCVFCYFSNRCTCFFVSCTLIASIFWENFNFVDLYKGDDDAHIFMISTATWELLIKHEIL